MNVVLDSSALLAWLQREPGSEVVTDELDGGVIPAANWSEVLQKTRQHGGNPDEVGLLLRALGLEVADVTRIDGETAAALWQRGHPLSLGDRLCLALAQRLTLPVVTADTRWTKSRSEVDVRLIR